MSKRRVTRKHIGRAANVGIIARGRQGSAQAIAVSCSIMEGSVNSLSIDISLDCGAAVYWPDLNVLFSMRRCNVMQWRLKCLTLRYFLLAVKLYAPAPD